MLGVTSMAVVGSEIDARLPLLPGVVQQALSAPPLTVFLHTAVVWAIVLLGIWALPFLSFDAKADGADRALSTLHAILATCCGLYVICAVQADCHKVTDETAVVYGFISLTASYLAVDLLSMFYVDMVRGWREVDKGMIAHHVGILSIYTSMVSGVLVNPHVYMAGCFQAMEASTPALNLIWLLRFLGKRDSRSYAMAGIAVLLVFVWCRIVLLPGVCWHWYFNVRCKNESVGLIIFNVAFYCMNVFWFTKLLSGAFAHGMFSRALGFVGSVDSAGDRGDQSVGQPLMNEEAAPEEGADETSRNGTNSSEPDVQET
mmetsp:Transcript_48934/g.90246  ORF Transcript_48934/g.90246 Transcript_48934/m.90246 type:complete len:316 (+) Transcript_48934:132-1079(+)